MTILASKSPRRTEILSKFGIEHIIVTKNVDEISVGDPINVVQTNAFNKGGAVSKEYPNDVVISADTIVTIDNIILGKPKDLSDAQAMLRRLSGRTHQVITSVAVFKGDKNISFNEITYVTFDEMTDDDINKYITSDYVLDKAGAYAVQSEYATFVKELKGSYYNVVGLPIERLLEELKKLD